MVCTMITNNSSTPSMPFVSAPSSPENCTVGLTTLLNASSSSKLDKLQVNSSVLTGMAAVVPLLWNERVVREVMQERKETRGPDEQLSFSVPSSDFDFSARLSEIDGQPLSPSVMSTADELFYNGHILPLQPLDQCWSAEKTAAAQSDDGSLCNFRISANYTNSPYHSPDVSERYDRSYNSVGAWEVLNNWNRDGRIGIQSQYLTASQFKRCEVDGGSGLPRLVNDFTERGREGRPRKYENRLDRKGGRITRSLSPLRVLQWYDEPARVSYEGGELFSTTVFLDGKDNMKRKNSSGWTLKELLGMGDRKVGTKQNWRSWTGSSSWITRSFQGNSGKKGKDRGAARAKSPRQKQQHQRQPPQQQKHHQQQQQHRNYVYSLSPKGTISPHELHYTKHRQQAEQMRKKTFLPYRHGVLGCLGFSFFPEDHDRSIASAVTSMKAMQHSF